MKKHFNVSVFIMLVILSVTCLTGCGDEFKDAKNLLEMEFLNVGKADCILIIMDDCVILNDAGDTDGFPEIQEALDSRNIKEIDYLIASHYDSDHIGCADDVMNEYDVDTLIGPDYVRDSNNYDNMIKAIADNDVDYEVLTEDYYIEEDYGKVWINVPNEDKYDKDNNYSLITSVEFGNHKFLLTGDALKERLKEFNAVCVDKYTLVKIPHHGNTNMQLRNFMNNSQVEYAVITTNNMGTVEEKLPELLTELDVEPYYTFNGKVVVRTDGNKLEINQK